MHLSRLHRLIAVLDDVDREERRFSMGAWFDLPGKEQPLCRSSACALGWAALDPELQAEGLFLEVYAFRVRPGLTSAVERLLLRLEDVADLHADPAIRGLEAEPRYGAAKGFEAARRFFGITPAAASWVFNPDSYPGFGQHTTAGEVIERVEQVIACGGDEPTEDDQPVEADDDL